MEHNQLACPICKKRISTWARNLNKRGGNGMVNQELWNKIQSEFPVEVEAKKAGLDDDPELVEECFPCLPIHNFAEQGSIAKEFEEQRKNIAEEFNADREKEAASFCFENGDDENEAPSPELIASQEEALRRFQQIKEDEEFARRAQEEENASPIASSSSSQSLSNGKSQSMSKGGGKMKTPKRNDKFRQKKLTDLFNRSKTT